MANTPLVASCYLDVWNTLLGMVIIIITLPTVSLFVKPIATIGLTIMKNSKRDNYKQFTLQMDISGLMLITESQNEVTNFTIIGKGDYNTCDKLKTMLADKLAKHKASTH